MIIRKIIPFLVLLILTIEISGQDHFFLIDSLSGRAEIQRESQIKWQFIKSGQKLYNNDVIQTLSKSHVRIKLIDNTLLFLNKQTRIQINLVQKKENSLVYHITVIYGEVFLKPSSSDSITWNNNIIIFSPSITLTPNSAGFLFVVNQDKSTIIKLLMGTLEMRDKKNNTLTSMGAPYKTLIDKSSGMNKKSAILIEDIDSLKQWIPAGVIDNVMKEQLSKARRASQILNGKLENKCIITMLENNSGYSGAWNISKDIPKFLAMKLQLTDNVLKIETPDTTVSNPLSMAKVQMARFFLTGKIIFFDIIQHAEISTQADEYREMRIGRIILQLTMTETQNNQIIFDNIFTGEVTQKRNQQNSWQIISELPFDLQDKSFSDCILGQAIIQALDQITEKIVGSY